MSAQRSYGWPRSQDNAPLQNLPGSVSVAPDGASARVGERVDADSQDLISEQRDLLLANAATFDQLAQPQTPTNPPWILTEDGLVDHLPTFDDSPLDQIVGGRSVSDGSIFGGLVTAQEAIANDVRSTDTLQNYHRNLSNQQRHQANDNDPASRRLVSFGNPSNNRLPRRIVTYGSSPAHTLRNRPQPPRGAGLPRRVLTYGEPSASSTAPLSGSDRVFGDWLPGHRPQAIVPAPPTAAREDDSDDARTPAQMIDEIQAEHARIEAMEFERWVDYMLSLIESDEAGGVSAN